MIEVDEFILAHHGVKGQHWGIRNLRQKFGGSKVGTGTKKKQPFHFTKKEKIAGAIIGTAAVAGGALYAEHILYTHGKTNINILGKLRGVGGPKQLDDTNPQHILAAVKDLKAKNPSVFNKENTNPQNLMKVYNELMIRGGVKQRPPKHSFVVRAIQKHRQKNQTS